MKTLLTVRCQRNSYWKGLALLVFSVASSLSFAQTSDYRGMMEFQQHCATCHESPVPGSRALGRSDLKALPAAKIYDALTVGKMSVIAQGLSDDVKRRIAEWLSGRPIEESDRSVAAMTNACLSGVKLSNPLAGSNWLGWSPDPTTSARFQPADTAGLDAADVANLKLKWAFALPGAATLRSQPIVGAGWLWVGSDNGMVYALDATTGCVYWSFESQRPVISSLTLGPTPGSPDRYSLYFGDFAANVYALDAETGKLLWSTEVGEHHAAAVSGSVVLDPSGERLVVPIGSWEEVASTHPSYECCTSTGGVAVLDVKTGQTIWKVSTLAMEAKPLWKNKLGVQQYGPSGAAVWSAPTIDAKRNAVYVGTANAYVPVPDGGASDAIFSFDLSSGELLWSKQLLAEDANAFSCDGSESSQQYCSGAQQGPNDDVSAPPIIYTLANGKQVLLASQESRRLTVLDPDKKGAIIWQDIPSDRSTGVSGNLGPASDGKLLYVPLAFATDQGFESTEGIEGKGGLVALKPETGEAVWTTIIPPPAKCAKDQPKLKVSANKYCTSANQGAVTVIPGVAFTGSVDGTMRAFSTADGRVLWDYYSKRDYQTINGIEGRGGSVGGPGPTVVNGMVYWGSGYAILGTTPGNVLLAFSVESDASSEQR